MDDMSPDPAADAEGVVVLLRVHLGALLQREVLRLLGQHGAAALRQPREHRPLQSLNPAGQTLVSAIHSASEKASTVCSCFQVSLLMVTKLPIIYDKHPNFASTSHV